MSNWIEDYDLYENVFQSALEFFITETSSTTGAVCILNSSDDLSFLSQSSEFLLDYRNTSIEKAIRTKTPLIVKTQTLPYFGETTSFFGIPIQNKERVLGVVILINGNYTLQHIRKFHNVLLILRLDMEKIQQQQQQQSPALTSKDIFIANMSHEIRTPLNGVIGYTQLLQQTKMDSHQKKYVDSINKCSLNLVQIINDILDFSKLSCGKMKVNQSPMCVSECVSFVKDTLTPKLNEKKQQITVEIQPSVPEFITSDKQKLIQVLMNFVSNAIKFTDTFGKIDIVLTTPSRDALKIAVRDTGVGISRENQTKLFRTFSQLDNKLTKSYDGTGLGLAISKKLIELLRGTIGFKSVVGVGSEFYFIIEYAKVKECVVLAEKYSDKNILVIGGDPIRVEMGVKCSYAKNIDEGLKMLATTDDIDMCIVYDSKSFSKITNKFPSIPILHHTAGISSFKLVEDIEKMLSESRYIKKKDSLRFRKDLKILIAEDNPDNQTVLLGMLNSLGYTDIKISNDGVEAIQHLQKQSFDVILLDLKMPRIDGYQVMEYLKKSEKVVKIVPVSASVMEEDKLLCKKYTPWFIQKPVDMKELQQCLLLY